MTRLNHHTSECRRRPQVASDVLTESGEYRTLWQLPQARRILVPNPECLQTLKRKTKMLEKEDD